MKRTAVCLFCLFLQVLVGFSQGARQATAYERSESDQTRRRLEKVGPTGQPEQKSVILDEESGDFGRQVVIKPRRTRPYIEASQSQDLLYTNNVFLSEMNPLRSALWVSNYSIKGFVPLPDDMQAWTISLDFQETLYRYDEDEAQVADFNRDAAGLNVMYQLGSDWLLGAGYGVSQLRSSEEEINEFYREGLFNYSAMKIFSLHADHALFVGASGEYHHATPAAFSRLNHGIFVGYNWQILPRVVTQLLIRSGMENYLQMTSDALGQIGPREDLNQMLSWSLFYSPVDWCTFKITGTSTFNNSSSEQRDYENLQGGGSLAMSFRY